MKTDVVVAGWGQVTQPKECVSPKDPMGLMEEAVRSAAQKLKNPDTLAMADGILVVKSLSAFYTDPANDLARRLGLSPKFTFQSRIGGNSPQTMINRAAGMIARKELNMVLIAGAESYVPRGTEETRCESALLKGMPEDYSDDDASGVTPLEAAYGIEHPMQGFPLFETALWGASGLPLAEYMKSVADFWSGFSRVAADHPYSWTRTPRSPEEILTPTSANRPIAFPYTKYMNSFITVDQGAAVILMSADLAESRGAARGRTVYFCGGGYAEDRQPYMIQKSDFTVSPPLKAAVDKALDRSGMTIGEIDCFDLYSCFPCAVSIAKKMMGLSGQDQRPMSLTGGLGFFGGPGNNYNLHAVATLCDMISENRTTTGLVTALGWFMQKHAAGIYSARAPRNALDDHHLQDLSDSLAGPEPVDIDEDPKGQGIIETYTVVYRRDRSPDYGVIYGRTKAGKRFIAKSVQDERLFNLMTSQNLIGREVVLKHETQTGLTMADLA